MKEQKMKAPVIEKGRYINPHAKEIKRSLFDVVLWKMGFYDDATPMSPIPSDFCYPVPDPQVDTQKPSVIWVNHSTFIIKVMGLTILTDPIWSKRCSPVAFLGPKRKHTPAFELEHLQSVDYVLISHNHYDHLDKKTIVKLHKLYPSICYFVPHGLKAWFTKLGIEKVYELSWWEQISLFSKGQRDVQLHVSSVPAQHFSGRGLTDINKTLWTGWVVECSKGSQMKRIYFAGDTGYNPVDFASIGHKWKSMDLSLIPIGSYSPRVFMGPVHIEPIDAVKIHLEVGSKQSVAMHWKTFCLSDEEMDHPPYELYMTMCERKIDPLHFLALPPGYEVNW